MRQRLVIGALVLASAGAHAASGPLTEDDLKAAVAGKTVSIDTPLGLPISVNYGADGIMTGSAGTALAVYLGAAKDRGRWYIKNGKLCQKWFKWLSGDTTCLTIRQDGLKIYWRSDEGKTGTAMIEVGPPVIDGASATGLGVPPQPVGVEKALAAENAAEQQPEAQATPQAPHHSPSAQPWPRATVAPARKQPPKSTASATPTVPIVRASYAPDAIEPAGSIATPALVETPRLALRSARPELQPSPSSAARFAFAAIVPHRPAAMLAAPVTAMMSGIDPFEAERGPMRLAADLAAIGVLEHRWCHANAFATGAEHAQGDEAAALPARGDRPDAPSLLAVAKEQVYEGELPLHAPACLTAAPAIGVAALIADRQ